MMLDDLLSQLEGVRRSGRGYMARCPVHADRNPSLSIREGERGILVHCWAGCSLADICAALGLTPARLFYDAGCFVNREAIRRSQARRRAAHIRQRAKGQRVDALREAEAVIRAAINPGLTGWTEEQVDAALNRVCDARELLEREDTDATEPESASA